MRFFYAKKEQKCHGCHTVVNYGDEAVAIRWRPKDVLFFIPLVFHAQCYIPWATENFNIRWNDWKMGATPRPIRHKRGRKFLYTTRKQAKEIHRLRSLKRYHLKAGNKEAAENIENKIKEVLSG